MGTSENGCAATAALAGPAPERLDDYRILREVGRGGMGIVYEAVQESLGRHVAFKVLPAQALKSPSHLERFQREARAAAKLHHTNIVPVFDVGEQHGIHYFAMQLIRGQSLDVVLEEVKRLRNVPTPPTGKLPQTNADVAFSVAQGLLTGQFAKPETPSADSRSPGEGQHATDSPALTVIDLSGSTSGIVGQREGPYFRSVASLGLQVAEALAYAHQQNILHRDVKPSNLLLDTRGTVWVTDFGLAKPVEGEELTAPGDIVGTLRYMAPERFEGRNDCRSDIFSLGLKLYEFLTLTPTYSGADRAQLIEQVCHAEPPRPRTLDATIPRDLETIVLKAIEKDPALRYPSAEALADDLRRFLADEPVKARRIGAAERLWRWRRRNRTVAGLSAAVLLLAITVAIGSTITALVLGRALRDTQQANIDANARLWDSLLTKARASRMTGRPGQRFDALRAIKEALQLPLPPGRSLDELRTEAIAALMLPDLEVCHELTDEFPAAWSYFAFDPGFKRYARGERSKGSVSVRSLDDGAELFRLPGPCAGYGGLAFSPDGRFLHQARSLVATRHGNRRPAIWSAGFHSWFHAGLAPRREPFGDGHPQRPRTNVGRSDAPPGGADHPWRKRAHVSLRPQRRTFVYHGVVGALAYS